MKAIAITSPSLLARLEPIDDLAIRIAHGEEDIAGVRVEDQTLDGVACASLSITGSRVVKTNFSTVEIPGFDVKNAVFVGCDMTMANFPEASWHMIELEKGLCSGMQLDNAYLKHTVFRDCKMDLVNFRFAELTNVLFERCVVREMDFYNATLKNVAFVDCEIDAVVFSGSKLQHVDLTRAKLSEVKNVAAFKGATFSNEQLIYLAPYLAATCGIKVDD